MKEKQFDINADIRANRHSFGNNALKEEHLHEDPFTSFEVWLKAAMDLGDPYANAMVLSTSGKEGMPDSRVVLLRNVSYGGFTFYTNYKSKKGRDIAENSKVCLLFFWREQARQVKIQGEIRFLPSKESDDYFAQRPFESQVGAWASQQSNVVESRQQLDGYYAEKLKHFEGQKVPRPEHWGGYVVLPVSFEFWQGRSGRLHDRIRYTWHAAEAAWNIERLMP